MFVSAKRGRSQEHVKNAAKLADEYTYLGAMVMTCISSVFVRLLTDGSRRLLAKSDGRVNFVDSTLKPNPY